MTSIVKTLGLAALILGADPTFAEDCVVFCFLDHDLKPDARAAHFDNACALAGAAITMGVDSPTLQDDIRECAKHFDGDACESTRTFILDSGKQIPPELKCLGKRDPNAKIQHFNFNPPPPDTTNARYDNACALASASIVHDDRENYEQNIADCARHPDKDACEATRSFIFQAGKKIPPELVCRGGG